MAFADLLLLTRPGRVFTPRVATERLVERAAELVRDRAARVADVGTGTGAIAIALALLAPRAEIWATDLDDDAVDLAAANVLRHGLEARVHVRHGDLLDPIPRGLDLVVANLPYLPEGEHDADVAEEPPHAVFAPGDGLGPYRRLLAQADERLGPRGLLVIQYRGRIHEATREELAALRRRLGELAAAA